jgi:PAS domain S-box-containing protein
MIMMFLILAGSWLISGFIVKPIKRLKDNVEDVSKGKLDIQLAKSDISEVQGLIDSLNRILATMKLAILRTGLTKGELCLGEALKAKEEAEDKYKLLYETSNDAIMTIEPPSWKFTAGNPAALRIYGIKTQEEFTKLGPWDLSPKKQPDGRDSAEEAKKMIEKAMKEGSAFFEWTHKRYNDGTFSATILLTRFKLNGKEVIQATVRDMNESGFALKETQEKYKALFDDASDAIFVHELKTGKFVEVNDTACKRLGYTKKEFMNLGPSDIDSPRFAKLVPKRIKELKKKGHLVFESAHVTKSGKEIPIELSSKIISYNGRPAIMSLARIIAKNSHEVEEK